MKKHGIIIDKLETKGNKRLEKGLKFMVKSMKGYRSLIQFFKEGGVDPWGEKTKGKLTVLPPVEQFLISREKRLFKGYDEYNFFRSSGEVDPNSLLRGNFGQGVYNPIPNPYFSTGGGSVGGNYVGPTSDIFTGHMFPQPMPGIHPTIRYDPIGPFGTFGGPPKKEKSKTTDPFMGGNPFGGGFPPNGKGPFGGNPFG